MTTHENPSQQPGHVADQRAAHEPDHVVVGAGAIGAHLARRLADRGDHVRVVTRSGNGPEHPRVECVAADASDVARLSSLAAGAQTIFNCANPPYPKWASAWPGLSHGVIGAAETTGARLVTIGNLYGYAADSSPMRATDELDPPTRKGAIRVATWHEALAAHDAGRIRATEVRASDFIGPGVGANGHAGDRFVPRILAGKRVSVLGRPDVEHSWSFVDDVVTTLVAVSCGRPCVRSGVARADRTPADVRAARRRSRVGCRRRAGRGEAPPPDAAEDRRVVQPDDSRAPGDAVPVRASVRDRRHRHDRDVRHRADTARRSAAGHDRVVSNGGTGRRLTDPSSPCAAASRRSTSPGCSVTSTVARSPVCSRPFSTPVFAMTLWKAVAVDERTG